MMHLNVGKEVAALQRMTVNELRAKYADVFGEATNANNKAWLVKRIAWRMQSLAEGDLLEQTRRLGRGDTVGVGWDQRRVVMVFHRWSKTSKLVNIHQYISSRLPGQGKIDPTPVGPLTATCKERSIANDSVDDSARAERRQELLNRDRRTKPLK